jgi:hypothetical protein
MPTKHKKSSHKVEFIDEEKPIDSRIHIIEPQEIYHLLSLLDETDEESVEQVKPLKTPLTLIRKEMNLSLAESCEDVKRSIAEAYKEMKAISKAPQRQIDGAPSAMKAVHQAFTDKLICVKDSHYLKLIHRDNQSAEFDLGQAACFSEPPRTLEDRITLQMLY